MKDLLHPARAFRLNGRLWLEGPTDQMMGIGRLTCTVPTLPVRFKLGATNVLKCYTIFPGGPSVGGLYYLALACTVN